MNAIFRHLTAVTFLVAAFTVSKSAYADTVTYSGCLNCVEQTQLTINIDHCVQVGDNQNGAGIVCRELSFFGGSICQTSGGACYNIDVNDGGGGSTADGYPFFNDPTSGGARSAEFSSCP
jgi:hypothetical protein